MTKPFQATPASGASGTHPADTDPWSEFLSESSAEFHSQHEDDHEEYQPRQEAVPADDTWESEAVPSAGETPSADEWRSNDGFESARSPQTVAPAFTPAPPASFVPAPEQPESSALVAIGSHANPVSLAEVSAHQISVPWSEAVATIEALCTVLIDSSTTRAVPELADVMITSAGTVTIRRGASGDRDIRTIARRLHALLASTTIPLPLRLFVTSSISTDRYHSVELYAEALSYYEAPGRTELIQALHRRIVEAMVSMPLVRLERSQAMESRARHATHSKTPMWVVLGAAAIVGAAGAGVAMWQGVLWPAPSSSSAAEPSTPANGPGGGQPPGAPAIGSGSGLAAAGVLERAVGAQAPKPEYALARAPGGGDARATPLRDDWAPGPISVPSTHRFSTLTPDVEVAAAPINRPLVSQPVAPAVPASVVRQTGYTPVPPPPAPPVSPPAARVSATAPQDLTIYSRTDSDVEPPVLLSVELSAPPEPPGPDSRATASRPLNPRVNNTLELIIDERGDVQSARLASPSRMSDAWLPSAAKNMKFRPATKNGVAVKYRLYMNWTSTPG